MLTPSFPSLPSSDLPYRLLIYGDAFACHGGLVDARSPDHDEPVCCQPFIGLYDYGVANDEFLDGTFAQTAVASPNHGSARRQFSQGLDRAFGPAHGVMFERMPEAEQEQKKSAFGPGAQGTRARCRHEHQRVDFETL